MTLPQPVDRIVGAYLRAVDAAQPGLVEGLYLTGSVAMGDFHAGRGIARLGPSGGSVSDIDFIAMTARPPGSAAVDALRRVHRRLAAARWRPSFDGVYLTWTDLARDPAEVTGRPQSHGGRLHTRGGGHPVLWQEFAQHAVAVRGVHRSAVPVELDAARLVSWARGNLDGYWRQWHGRTAQALSLPGMVGLTRWAPTWGVLGVSRLHYTIRTARVCSKSAGGRYARDLFDPRWHPILDECLRIRAGLLGRPRYATAARRRDALDFIAMVIDDGVRIG